MPFTDPSAALMAAASVFTEQLLWEIQKYA